MSSSTVAPRATLASPARDHVLARLVQVLFGTALMGVSLALLVRARLGLLPIDVLHTAVATHTGWTLGGGIIATQAVLLALWIPLRIRPGAGTIVGVLVPGIACDIVLSILPDPASLLVRVALLVAAGVGFAVGVALYLGADLGAVPRDGLIMFLHRRGFGLSSVRVLLDVACLAGGWLLLGLTAAVRHGTVGAGSVLLALVLGPAIARLLPVVTTTRSPSRPSTSAPSDTLTTPATTASSAPPRGTALRSERRHGHDLSLRRHLQVLLYTSFRHAQGSQRLQVHFIQSYVRLVRERGVPFDPAAGDLLAEHAGRFQLPGGHIEIVDEQLVRAQFAFWAHRVWDVVQSIYHDAPHRLPDRAQLEDHARVVGGTKQMSSFADDEMAAVAEALTVYRTTDGHRLGGVEVVHRWLLPSLLEVETRFQGSGERYPSRPRTDGGDIHECRMFGHCQRALQRYQLDRADTTDTIYRAICQRLTDLSEPGIRDDPVAIAYRQLIATYNRNHPTHTVAELHVPDAAFLPKSSDAR